MPAQLAVQPSREQYIRLALGGEGIYCLPVFGPSHRSMCAPAHVCSGSEEAKQPAKPGRGFVQD